MPQRRPRRWRVILNEAVTRVAGRFVRAEPLRTAGQFVEGLLSDAGTNSLRWGVWTHITANYNKDINLMTLYIDGANVARGTHSTVWNATGGFRISSHKTTSSTYAGYFGGELAFAQTWDQAWNIADAPDERQANEVATLSRYARALGARMRIIFDYGSDLRQIA